MASINAGSNQSHEKPSLAKIYFYLFLKLLILWTFSAFWVTINIRLTSNFLKSENAGSADRKLEGCSKQSQYCFSEGWWFLSLCKLYFKHFTHLPRYCHKLTLSSLFFIGGWSGSRHEGQKTLWPHLFLQQKEQRKSLMYWEVPGAFTPNDYCFVTIIIICIFTILNYSGLKYIEII